MCWSPEASIGIAAAGVAATAWCYKKKEPLLLVIPLGYFTLMEILQAYSYTVIDECMNPGNQAATYLAYIHVALQPIFANMIGLYFVPDPVRKKVQTVVYTLAIIASLAMLARIMPLEWKRYCFDIVYRVPFSTILYHVPFCGTETCTYSGSWHLAWSIPAGHKLILDYGYLLGVFILPLFYGSWKASAYIALVGPAFAIYMSGSANEFAAVWCLFSIGIVGMLMIKPLRKLLFVNSVYGLMEQPDVQKT